MVFFREESERERERVPGTPNHAESRPFDSIDRAPVVWDASAMPQYRCSGMSAAGLALPAARGVGLCLKRRGRFCVRRASVGSNEAVYKGMRLAGLSGTGRGEVEAISWFAAQRSNNNANASPTRTMCPYAIACTH